MELLIPILILLLVIGLVYWAITAIPLPQPVRVAAIVVVALIAIVFLLSYLPGVHLTR